jgi:predicted nucleic acid-binding protein
LTREILTAIETGRIAGLTTTITLSELLTRPAQANDLRAMQEYELYIAHLPNLRLVSLDTSLARETARIRAATGLRTPDAVQIAAALFYQADAIVTNDHRWQNHTRGADLILLDEYA